MKQAFWRQWPLVRAWKAFRDFSKRTGIRPLVFLWPSLAALLGALADGVSVGLLIPTIQGVISKNFLFIHQKPVLQELAGMLPGVLSQSNAAIFILLVLLIFFFALVKNVLVYISSLMTLFQVRECSNKIRKMVYERYLSFGKAFFDKASSGHLHQILVGYTQQVAQEFKVLQDGIFRVFSLIVYTTVAFLISWKLTLFSAITFPILHFSLRVLIQKINNSSKSFSSAYSEMGAKISNALSCMMLVKAYTNEEKEKQWFSFTSDRVRNCQFSIDKKSLLISPFQEIVGLCIILLLVGVMAFLFVREKSGEVAGFLVFFLVLRRASSQFGVFTLFQSTLAGIRGPLSELREIFDDKGKAIIPEGFRTLTALREKIEFKDLNFSYVEGRPILDHFNFSVKKGEAVAMVGSSGSGKSTVVNLLMRFYDTPPGTLLIDGTDIREFTLRSLRSKIALVSQDTLLLNAPFRLNLVYGLERRVSDAELEAVLEKARLLQIAKLIGLDAQIGERGVKLSGGERQRLSIARAMLKNPEILILDEATSSLDTTTERLIQAALDEIVVGKTVIVIAHRLATIRDADRIVVLEKGRVREEGSFMELLAQKEGRFYSYWQSQKINDAK